MNRDPEREAVVRQAERSWLDIVEVYEAGRTAFVDARVRDYNMSRRIADAITATQCGPNCPNAPHAHPVTIDDELRNLL